MYGRKRIINDFNYEYLVKHYCPVCGIKLDRIKVKKLVNQNSSEAENYDFSCGDADFIGDVLFIWNEFKCKKCNFQASIEKLKSIEEEKLKT